MAAIELATGYVTLAIETADLGKQVGQMFSGVEVTASKSGRKMGEQMAKAFEQSKPDVDKLEADFKKAQEKVVRHKEVGSRKIEAADRKVEIQQARVNEMLQKYGDESSQYLRANDQLVTAKQKAEAETLAYESALGKLESQLGDTRDALNEAEKATEDTGDSAAGAADNYAKGWRGVAQRMRDTLVHGVSDASDEAAVEAEAGGDKAGTFWSRAMETAVGVGLYKLGSNAISKLGDLFSNAFSGGWDRVTAMDDAQAKLSGLGYEAQDVTGIMGDVEAALGKTAFLYSDGASAAAGSMSALKEQGIELENYLRLVSDATTQSNTDFNSMSQIMGKVVGDGKLTGATMQQMMDNGLQAAPMLAEAFGVTQAEVRKMASEGEISADMFMEAMDEKIGGAAENAADTVSGSLMLAKTSISQFGESVLTNLAPYIQSAAGYFSDFMYSLAPMGEQIGETIGVAIEWFGDNTDTIKTFALIIGTATVGLGAFFAVIKIAAMYKKYTEWLNGATLAQKGLNAAMNANPIGVVVLALTALVAGFIWAYNEIGWFKDGVNAVLDALGTGWNWLYENAISPAIDGIVAGWTWLSDTFTAAWESHLSPVFSAIGTVFTWLWQNIISPYIGFMVGLFLSFGEVISWVWTNVLSHVFNAIGAVVVWLWQNVVSPYIGFIGAYWSAIFTGMGWAWDNILKPVFLGVAAAAIVLWNNVLKPTFAWIGENWSTVMDIMAWAWNFVLKPAWDGLVLVLSWMWNSVLSPTFGWIGEKWDNILKGMELVWVNVLQPAFQKIGDTVLDLWGKFQTGVDNIKKVWDTLQGIAAKPIKFVIEKVINDGLISGFNSLIGLIPFMDLEVDPVPVPSWMAGYYDGGWTGPGSKYDPAGLVHADEFVVQKASRRMFERENPGLLDHINRHGTFAGYADGGLVQPVRGKFTSGFGASRGRYPHAGVDWAVPIGTPVLAALAGTALGHQPAGRTGRYVFLAHPGNRNTYYGHLSQPMVSPGDQVAQGQVIGLSGNTGNSTGPHLHFETWVGGTPVDPMKYMGGLPTSESGGEGWFDPLAPLRALGEKIGGWFTEKFPAGGFLVDAAKQTATGAIDGVIDWLTDVIPFMGDPDDGASSNAHGAASGLIQQQVKDVAAKYGWSTGAQWNAIDAIATKESGWRLNAKNPNSSAEGIFQQMTSIHGPVASTATGQAEWFMKYIGDRYGTPTNALAFHNRNNWYADGGLVQPTIGALTRDSGGVVPPGTSVINNYTRDPEWMYTNKQQDTVQDALDIVKTGSGKQLHVHLNGDGVTVGDVFRKFEFEERREARV